MPLLGTYQRLVDDKQRVALPKRLYEELGEGDLSHFYISPGTELALLLFSPRGFQRYGRRLAKQTSNRVSVRNYKRLFFAQSEKVELDGQGRIRIPERLIEFARLERDVVLLGVDDHMEIWNAAAWKSFVEQTAAAFDDMATQAFEERPS
jgi:MraZ protein